MKESLREGIIIKEKGDDIITIIKRNGEFVEYDGEKIIYAIKRSMSEGETGIDDKMANEIEQCIFEEINNEFHQGLFSVENIQDLVENNLMKNGRWNTARRYIKYRAERERVRNKLEMWKPYKNFEFLSNEFLRKYADNPDPFKSEISKFTFYRTYSRYLPSEKRRETWLEMNARVADYLTELDPVGSKKSAEILFDNLFNFKVFSSGRIRYTGGTKSIKKNFQSAFNCSAVRIDDVIKFSETMTLLLLGCGVGFSVYKDDIKNIQPVRHDVEVIMKNYVPVAKHERKELTTTTLHNNSIMEIIVGDSKSAWSGAIRTYFDIITNRGMSSAERVVKTILFNFDNIRGRGERLETFGGTSSGYIPLMKTLQGIHNTIQNSNGEQISRGRLRLKSIDVLDIMGLIAESVVSGGVRRSSLLSLIETDDEEIKKAKSNLYTQISGNWEVNESIIHRSMANMTVMYKQKPSREVLHNHIETMRYTGEPALANLQEMERRKPDASLSNPCFEILLKDRQHCNLTIINMMAFINEDNSVNYKGIELSISLATKMAFIISLQELDLLEWDKVAREDRIIGVSLTGLQDFYNKTNILKEDKIKLLNFMRDIAYSENERLATLYNVEPAKLVTSMQPAGTVSILPNSVSSGMHYSHSPYYIRRIRVNSEDPISKSMVDSGFEWKPEVGQSIENHNTKVFEFIVKAPEGKTKYDVSAIEQLEEYKLLMKNYCDQNVSSTVHVRNNEWGDVEQWLWDNWDSFVGISFLSLDDNFYELLPYESITKERYEELIDLQPKLNIDYLRKYETGEEFEIDENSGCETGHCPIR